MSFKNKKIPTINVEVEEEYSILSNKAYQSQIIDAAAKYFNLSRKQIKLTPIYKKTIQVGSERLSTQMQNAVTQNELSSVYTEYIKNNFKKYDLELFFDIDKKVAENLTTKEVVNDRGYNLKYIKGENLLCYGEFYRQFDDNGLTVVNSSPANEGGKSSLRKLIPILLYGELIHDEGQKSKFERLMNDHIESNYSWIEGEIEVKGEIFHLKREFTKDEKGKVKHTFNVTKTDVNGIVEEQNEETAKKTNVELEKHIGTLDDFFFTTLYTQSNVFKWLETKPTERHQLFVESLGLGILDEKREIADKLHKEWKLKTVFNNHDVKDLQEEIKTIRVKISHLKATNEEFEIESLSIEQPIENLKDEIKTQNSKLKPKPSDSIDWNELPTLKIKVNNLYDSKEDLENHLKNTETIEKPSISLPELQEKNNKIVNSISNIEKDYIFVELKKEIEGCQSKKLEFVEKVYDASSSLKRIEELQNDKLNFKQDTDSLDVLKSKLQDLQTEYKVHQSSLKSLEQQLKDAPENIVCDHCKITLSDSTELKQELRERIETAKERLVLLTKQGGEVKNNVTNLQSLLEEQKVTYFSQIDSQINQLRTLIQIESDKIKLENIENKKWLFCLLDLEISALQSEYNIRLEANKSSLLKEKQQNDSLIDQHNKSEAQALKIERLVLQIQKLEHEIKTTQEKINLIESYQDVFEFNLNLSAHISTLVEKLRELENEKNDIFNKIKLNDLTIEKHEEDIETVQTKINKIEDELKIDAAYKLYGQVHKKGGISTHIILGVLPTLNIELQEILKDIHFSIEIEFANNGIEFYFTDEIAKRPLYECSGLQKTLGCLALHLVNIKISTLPKTNFICLDECFGGVADVNLTLLKTILSKYKETFGNVDIITHIGEIKDWADTVVNIEKDLETKVSRIL